ncbi:MAG: DUF3667 domain-containing protein [Bacteroidetes bacterium]|nr:DUF3667 domain-containing protein [Bacteroidota bacterium]
MSHLKERKEKICLNCKAELYARYCHICGQENLEPKETVWHLVSHFFNDITHFDGKFFSTVKYLMRKPGFLSKEYMAGRRMSYLNPIRMYVFTSAIFFIFLFSLQRPKDVMHEKNRKESASTVKEVRERRDRYAKEALTETDQEDREDLESSVKKLDIELAMIGKKYGDSTRQTFSRADLRELLIEAYTDSLGKGEISETDRKRMQQIVRAAENPSSGSDFFGLKQGQYRTVEEYDSTERTLAPDLRDGWLKRQAMHRLIILDEEFNADSGRFKEHLLENIFHSFPKILFVSLPLFALILNILYYRHKQYYYVDHGIFTIHVYCATFILLLAMMLLGRVEDWVGWGWFRTLVNVLIFLVGVYTFIYLYKAMRGFYGQGRGKTFLKYFIVCCVASVVNLILFLIFLLISVISI